MSKQHPLSARHVRWAAGVLGVLCGASTTTTMAGPFKLPGKNKSEVAAEQAARTAAAGAQASTVTEVPKSVLNQSKPDADRTIELNYLEASWKTVLTDLAEQFNSNLVAEQRLIPSGRYTRRDKGRYTPAEALKIINRELDLRGGVRAVLQANHLVLMETRVTRAEYTRPAIQGTQVITDGSPRKLTDEGKAHIISSRPPTTPRTTPRNTSIQQVAAQDNLGAGLETIPTTAENPLQRAAGGHPLNARSTLSKSVNQRIITMSVATEYRSVQDVTRIYYRAFQKQSELIDDGPHGFPGMRLKPATGAIVQTSGEQTAQTPILEMGIDADKNEVWLQGQAGAVQQTAELLRRLDTPTKRGETTQLAVSRKKPDEIRALAKNLQPQLMALVQQRALAEDAEAEEAPAEAPVAAPADPNQPLPDLLGGLKGDVSIEALPDLGVMIIKGNQKDVDAVTAIIKEIEKLSVGAAPDVHLLMLKHSNSEALAELMTTVYDRLSIATGIGRARGAVSGAAGQPGQSGNTKVSILPVVKPNALLIVASANEMDSILKLAEELDQPVDPLSEFEVFPLKHAVPDQIMEMLETFYAERGGLGSRVLAVADPRTNTVVIQARPRDLEEVAALIKKIDVGTSGVVSQMRIFNLKYATADELSAVLNETLQSVINPPQQSRTGAQGNQGGGFNPFGGGGAAGGQGSAQLRAARSAVLQFLATDGRSERLLKSGLLSDIRITADARTNSLIITAPEESLPLIEALIEQLDRSSNAIAEIKVFQLSNSDARSMSTLLTELFTGDQQSSQQAAQRLGIQIAGGADDANSGLIPLKFSVDPRTNSIIATGSAQALNVVEAILVRLDTRIEEGDLRQRKSLVFRLKNSPAEQVAQSINDFLTSRRELDQSSDGLVSNFEQIEREVIVVPEAVSNTLLISATARFFDEIKELVTTLDAAPQQVVIQALLVEVTLDNVDEFGVELGLQDSVLFRRSVVDQLVTTNTTTTELGVQTTSQNIISQSSIPGFLFNNQQLGNNTNASPGLVGKQGLSSFGIGRTNGDLGYGGLVLAAGSESVSVLLRALAANRKVDILSRPQIRTLDNQLGVIQVGQDVPVVNGVTVNAVGGANPQVVQQNAGIILQVTPRISPDGRVVMEVQAERSEFLPNDQGVPIFTDVTTGQIIRAPRKDISTARTVVSVSNEQTVVIGGMITKTDTSIQRKVPWLGDLPFLGIPFRYNFNQSVKRELLIFLTPRVIRTDAESEYIKQVEMERIHFMEADAEEMHGPLRAAPPENADGVTVPRIIEEVNPAPSVPAPPPAPLDPGPAFEGM